MDTAITKNPNSKKGITCTLHNPRVSETDADNSFTNRLEVLKQHLTYKRNLAGIVAANPPQRNCSVYNETHYGNFEIASILANHLRVFDETFGLNQQMIHLSSVMVKKYLLKSRHTIIIKILGVIFILETVLQHEETFLIH